MNTLPTLNTIQHNNLNVVVYNEIKQALLNGDFRPHDKIRIRSLATQLGISVTPVRDAILRLVQEQVLEMRSPKDIRVPLLSKEEYLEIRLIRIELEGLATEIAAQKISENQVQDLKKLIDNNNEAIIKKDLPLARKQNREFHFNIMRIANMPTLEGIVDRLWMQTAPLVAMAYTTSYTDDLRIAHHYDVLNYLAKSDGPMARQSIQEDIKAGSDIILELIDEISS